MSQTKESLVIPEPMVREGVKTPSTSQSSFSRKVLIGVLTLIAATFPLWHGFWMPGMGMDEGTLLVYPEQILKGKLPYTDFETFYGPANIYVLAGAYSIFGVGIEVERAVGLLYRLLILAGVFAFASRWGTAAGVVTTMFGGFILLCMLAVPIAWLVAFAWLGGVACLIWSILCLSGTPSSWRIVLGGVLAGVALLYRQDLGPAVILSAIPMLLSLAPRQRWLYMGGGALGLLPMVALLVKVGWRPLWENLFLYPVMICNPGRRLPLSSAPDEMVFLFFLHFGAAVCLILAGAIACWRNRHSQQARIFLSFALVALGLTHQMLQRVDLVHVAMTVFLSVALLPLGLTLLMRQGRLEVLPVRLFFGVTALIIAIVAVDAPHLSRSVLSQYAFGLNPQRGIARDVVVGDRHFPTIILPVETQRVVNILEQMAKPGERLFVGISDLRLAYVNDTFIYHLVPWMKPASYFLEMNPFSANRPGSRLAADVASADWLVLNELWSRPPEPNLAGQPGDEAAVDVVRTQFRLLGRYGPYRLYCRKEAVPMASKRYLEDSSEASAR